MMRRREHGLTSKLTFLVLAALLGLSTSACDESIDIPNAPATIPAVGDIDPPVEGCNAEVTTTDTGADATDAGAAPERVRVSRDDSALVLPYLIKDREGDDQRIKVELCRLSDGEAVDCGVAVQAAGGDGSNFVPTTPAGTCILHVFYWDVGCGRFVGTDSAESPQQVMIESVDEELVAQVSVPRSDEEPTRSEPFTLSGIGFESMPACD